MSEHPHSSPAMSWTCARGEPSGEADTTAAFTDLVYADHDLLCAEFVAIITANFPNRALDQPERRDPTVAVLTGRVWPPHPAVPPPHRPGPGVVTGVPLRRQARQRGPPRPARLPRHRKEVITPPTMLDVCGRTGLVAAPPGLIRGHRHRDPHRLDRATHPATVPDDRTVPESRAAAPPTPRPAGPLPEADP